MLLPLLVTTTMVGHLDYQAAYQAPVTEPVDEPVHPHSKDLHGCLLGSNLLLFFGSWKQSLCQVLSMLCQPQLVNCWQEAIDILVQLECSDRLSSDIYPLAVH